ncbi:MAG TPA: anthrone oxygenase family protein [Novosphingobium sp.]
MQSVLIVAMLWISALCCALMAGLYFAFSTFIMRALGRIDRSAAIAAMNAINVDIQRSLFMPIFLGSTLIAAVLVVVTLLDLAAPYAAPALMGSAIYVAGMFVVTMARNVPLNNALAAIEPRDGATNPLWPRYLTEWTRWNHVRTLASLTGCALDIRAISLL